MGQQNFRLRSEEQRVVKHAPVKRLLSESIARDQQTASAAVPQSEGEHAVELSDHSVAVLFIQVRQDFSVGSAAKCMSAFFEFRAQLAIVVDFAVEDHGDAPVFVENRLFACDEIDDGESSHAKCYAGRYK